MQSVSIESLDQEGRGIAHVDGKVVFIEGALPGETVTYTPYRRKPAYEFATVQSVRKTSPVRTEPRCRFFARCGGCSLQHLDARAQVAVKQRVLEDSLRHIGKVRAELILPAIQGAAWGYRDRARLSVRHVAKKGGMLVGFHERRSSFIADMTSCEVLPAHLSNLLIPLRRMLGGLTIRERLPQIEVAVGEGVTALVLRVLRPLTDEDYACLRAFASDHDVRLYLQPGGPESAHALTEEDEEDLCYELPEFQLRLRFRPTEFTQVNMAVNRVLVRRAVQLLDPQPEERIGDMFSGIGNFSLAIARRGSRVLGVEGSSTLAARAAANAAANGLGERVEFQVQNLFDIDSEATAALGRFDRMLIDPPRDGAVELVKALGTDKPARIVYVSCNPATLARDASVLVHARGYRLSAAGVINMFPHTSHVESLAVFDRGN